MLKFPMLWTVLAIALIAAAIVFVALRRHGSMGFRDAVENPEAWRKEVAAANLAHERALEQASKWDESQIAAAVNRFVFDIAISREAAADAHLLGSLGAKVYPAVLDILADTARRGKLVTPTGEDSLPEAPFNRACDLLGHTPPANAAALIAPFLDQPGREIRTDAALVLGKIGTAEVVIPLRKALADPDEHVRSYGLMGLDWAIRKNRLREECGRGLYDDIVPLVVSGKNIDKAAPLLLHIDPARATELFLSDRLFAADARSIHYTLKALAEKSISVPRERLLALIADLEKGEMKYPRNYALGEALRLLGQHKLVGDREFLQARTRSPDREAARGAAAGLIASFGLEGFEKRIWDAEEKHGFSGLKRPQQYYLAVLSYDGQVNNGGLSQYFFNSSGDHWPQALAGLQAMGFVERLAVLREAVARFGKDGPSQDRNRRQEQLAKLERKSDDVFGSLGDRYYKSKESIDVLSQQYVLNNAEAFE